MFTKLEFTNHKEPMTIIIADDHPIVLHGMKSFLEQKGITVLHTCINGIEAYNLIMITKPQIALLDIDMPGMSGIEIIEKAIREKSKTHFILLTMHNEFSLLKKAKKIGAKGYLLKDFAMDEIEKCMEEVMKGKTYFSAFLEPKIMIDKDADNSSGIDLLTFSEKKIVQLIAEQKSNKQIAEQLFITERTVESHRSNIIKKLNLPKEKNALLMWAISQK